MTPENEKKGIKRKTNRRKFLKNGVVLGATGTATLSGLQTIEGIGHPGSSSTTHGENENQEGEVLYNGIQLAKEWPPRSRRADSYDSMPVPYLSSPPSVIPVDVGRQLFVDGFLIEYTNLKRVFHQPVKHVVNPLLKPETEVEINQGYCPMAAPFSDGCFYDPEDKLFKLWYMAGWFDGTALATSTDGIHWERPTLDIVPGTNLVFYPKGLRRDGLSIWLDHEAKEIDQRFKMYVYERAGDIGKLLGQEDPEGWFDNESPNKAGGFVLTSHDGIHWKMRGQVGKTGDNTTLFYNPFRKQWVFTLRTVGRAQPPWDIDSSNSGSNGQPRRGRARSYWENPDFMAAVGGWDGFNPVFWLGMDRDDPKRANYDIGRQPQLYKIDAVGYESLMLGLIQVHYGPPNSVGAQGGFPKLTELQLAFSRDGFHWDRTCRDTFISGRPHDKDSWERAYVHSIGGVCNVVNDKLYFYYTAFQGDESNQNSIPFWSGLYANASTGLAVLRRDGFASIEAQQNEGILLTRVITFSGKHLFVNIDGSSGRLYAEICQVDGRPMSGFTRNECLPISTDSTKQLVVWKNRGNLESLSGKPIRIKFYLTNAKLYSFWVSRTRDGASGGATAAGGPGLTGTWDV